MWPQGWNSTAAFLSEHTTHSSICGGTEKRKQKMTTEIKTPPGWKIITALHWSERCIKLLSFFCYIATCWPTHTHFYIMWHWFICKQKMLSCMYGHEPENPFIYSRTEQQWYHGLSNTLVLDWTCSLQMRHFLTRGEQREQVAMCPQGPNKVSLFMSEQTMHSSRDSMLLFRDGLRVPTWTLNMKNTARS